MLIAIVSIILLVPTRAVGYPNCTSLDAASDRDDSFDFELKWHAFDHEKLQQCENAAVNPRGMYKASLAPCSFLFHRVDNATDEKLSAYQLSTACTDENVVPHDDADKHEIVVKDYVKKWPDDCVKDFRRCYKVPRDESIYLKFVCKKNWTFPKHTTHVSVDCREDKKLKDMTANSEESRRIPPDSEDHPVVIASKDLQFTIVVVVAMILVVAIGTSYAAYICVLKPYLEIEKEKLM